MNQNKAVEVTVVEHRPEVKVEVVKNDTRKIVNEDGSTQIVVIGDKPSIEPVHTTTKETIIHPKEVREPVLLPDIVAQPHQIESEIQQLLDDGRKSHQFTIEQLHSEINAIGVDITAADANLSKLTAERDSLSIEVGDFIETQTSFAQMQNQTTTDQLNETNEIVANLKEQLFGLEKRTSESITTSQNHNTQKAEAKASIMGDAVLATVEAVKTEMKLRKEADFIADRTHKHLAEEILKLRNQISDLKACDKDTTATLNESITKNSQNIEDNTYLLQAQELKNDELEVTANLVGRSALFIQIAKGDKLSTMRSEIDPVWSKVKKIGAHIDNREITLTSHTSEHAKLLHRTLESMPSQEQMSIELKTKADQIYAQSGRLTDRETEISTKEAESVDFRSAIRRTIARPLPMQKSISSVNNFAGAPYDAVAQPMGFYAYTPATTMDRQRNSE